MPFHSKIRNYLKRYIRDKSEDEEPLDSLRSLSFLLGFTAMFMGSISMTFDRFPFGDGTLGEDPGWHIRPFDFPVWEFVFIGGGICLVAASYFLKMVAEAHACATIAWLTSGVTWIVYGIMFRPDYVFALGVLSVFMAGTHAIMFRLWSIEKVERWTY